MNKILELVQTYRAPLSWAVLILNLLAGLSAIMVGNIAQTIFHFSIVIVVLLDWIDHRGEQ